MANPFRGEAQIGTSDYVLVCDINALCEIEAHFGGGSVAPDTLADALRRLDAGDLSMTDQRAVLRALLRARHPDVTIRAAGQIMADHPDAVYPAMLLAISRAYPEPEPGKK